MSELRDIDRYLQHLAEDLLPSSWPDDKVERHKKAKRLFKGFLSKALANVERLGKIVDKVPARRAKDEVGNFLSAASGALAQVSATPPEEPAPEEEEPAKAISAPEEKI